MTEQQQQPITNNSTSHNYYVTAKDAAALEADLLSDFYFGGRERFLELAGLGVAEAVYQVIVASGVTSSPATSRTEDTRIVPNEKIPRMVVVCCGPGTQGGYGLVAARHLTQFGVDNCVVVYPNHNNNQSEQPLATSLVRHCQMVGVQVLDTMPNISSADLDCRVILVDALSGVEGSILEEDPFAAIVHQMIAVQQNNTPESKSVTVISVDAPCGWERRDKGDLMAEGSTRIWEPDVLISVTAPNECTRGFEGRHFVAGRYLPPILAQKYSLQIPSYPGVSQVVELPRIPVTTTIAMADVTVSNNPNPNNDTLDTPASLGWEAEYAAYLNQREEAIVDNNAADITSNESQSKLEASSPKEKANESWAQEYQAYCAEKEASLAQQNKAVRKQDEQKVPTKQEVTLSWEQQYQDYCFEKSNKDEEFSQAT